MDQEFKPSKNLDPNTVEGDDRKDLDDQRPPDDAPKEKLGPWLIRNAPYLVVVLASLDDSAPGHYEFVSRATLKCEQLGVSSSPQPGDQ